MFMHGNEWWLDKINTNLTTSVFSKMSVVANTVYKAGLDFKLHAGYSAETSGKLFA